jgi:hypothetical protein
MFAPLMKLARARDEGDDVGDLLWSAESAHGVVA